MRDRRFLPVGYKLAGRFEVLDHPPKSGSFGQTYKARDISKGRIVALKEYFPDSGATRGADGLAVHFTDEATRIHLGFFRKEADALKRCPQHPGLASFVAAEIANGTGYLALEWINGNELGAEPQASDHQLKSWFLQLADAVLQLGKENLVS